MDIISDKNVTVEALRSSTKSRICDLLNPVMVIPTEAGTYRNWKGLAALCGIDPDYMASIEENQDPTSKVLWLWYDRDPEHSTVQQLILFLEEMDRFDIITDMTASIEVDIKLYNEKPLNEKIKLSAVEHNKLILTTDDVLRLREGLPLETYDAFVLYDQEDIDFATMLIDVMENTHGMKFVIRDRDLIGGGLELEKMVQLITTRCNRLIVILSDAFFKSSANQYYLSFARAYGIESENKIIPCMYKDCVLPPDIKCLFVLDYRRMQVFNNFWIKLKTSLMNVNPANPLQTRSVPRCNLLNGLRQLHQVKFSQSTGDLNTLETIPDLPLPPSNSAENVGPATATIRKKKFGLFKTHWIKSLKRKSQKNKERVAVS